MNCNEFLGIFLTRPECSSSEFPISGAHSKWQVWRTPVDIYLIQPVGSQHTSIDNIFPLNEDNFKNFLTPEHEACASLQSDSLHLLEIWYQKAIEAQNANRPLGNKFFEEKSNQKSCHLSTEKVYSYELTRNIQAKMRNEIVKLHENQRSQSTYELERLLDDLDSFPESDMSDWLSPMVFTELGVAFRREKLYKLALLCHSRAHELSPEDERILFNLARTEFELKNTKGSRQLLKQILESNPNFNVARDFLTFLDGSK